MRSSKRTDAMSFSVHGRSYEHVLSHHLHGRARRGRRPGRSATASTRAATTAASSRPTRRHAARCAARRRLGCGPWPFPSNVPAAPAARALALGLPQGDGWAYEPKWDGFRAIAFVDGDEVQLQSRNGRDLTRYFPELRFAPGRLHPRRRDRHPRRVGPAGVRPPRPAHPSRQVARRDARREDAGDLHRLRPPCARRRRPARAALPRAPRRARGARRRDPVELTPMVRAADEAEHWLQEAEGVIAKEAKAIYKPGERVGMVKVKRVRTIDAVVMGWRPGKAENTVGALILGLYDEGGKPPRGRALERLHGQGEARARRQVRPVRDRRARLRRAVALDDGPRARVGACCAPSSSSR